LRTKRRTQAREMIVGGFIVIMLVGLWEGEQGIAGRGRYL
jgi:uncharacterized membrane protein YiaA